jgi:16S rRNA (cytosine967-C5)-methyltransferase
MKRGVEARIIAATILERVLGEGAYSNVVVRTATEHLVRRDADFVQLLVYTAIRHLARIDRTIDEHASRPPDDVVLSVLRIGVSEILFTDGEPHAVVDSAVEAIKALDMPRASGFVNGVLRAVVRSGEPALPEGVEGVALRHGVPTWLYRDLADAYGANEAGAFFEASNMATRVGVRRRSGEAPGDPVPGIADAYLIDGIAANRTAIVAGRIVVSDPSSIAVTLALDPRPGDRVIDLAAAPGGKTIHIWDLLNGEGNVIAMDRHARRATVARRRTEHLAASVQWVIGDAARPPFPDAAFDRVLLDAPCTGLGTLRRRPEIRHRVDRDGVAAAAALQRGMLEAALKLVKPGGRLVYSVCTVTPEETVGVVAGTGSRPPADLPGVDLDGGILLGPHITGSDGMFIAVIDR